MVLGNGTRSQTFFPNGFLGDRKGLVKDLKRDLKGYQKQWDKAVGSSQDTALVQEGSEEGDCMEKQAGLEERGPERKEQAGLRLVLETRETRPGGRIRFFYSMGFLKICVSLSF